MEFLTRMFARAWYSRPQVPPGWPPHPETWCPPPGGTNLAMPRDGDGEQAR